MRKRSRSISGRLAAAAVLLATTASQAAAQKPAAAPLAPFAAASSGVTSPIRASLPTSELPRAVANDNRRPAGVLRGDTLFLELEVRLGRWFPEAEDGPCIDAPILGEVGGALQVPAPLIRVPQGTTVVVGVSNQLADSVVNIFGLHDRREGLADSLTVPPGARAVATFTAASAGTFPYLAAAGSVDSDAREREQLAGAFVVDEPGIAADDRVLVINAWGEPLDSATYRNALTVNGKAWPHSEVLSYTEGDSVRWRVVNGSMRPHPMHLHGYYFEVRAHGTAERDSLVLPANRRLAVTQTLRAGETMALAWYADRPGNWLFHCHLIFHALPGASLSGTESGGVHDHDQHMGGLVTGIVVEPKAAVVLAAAPSPRRLHLYVNEGPRRGRAARALGYVLARDGAPPAADSLEKVGSPLIFNRGEDAEVLVHNRLREPTAVHWHGLEIESPWDGVVGWSGFGSSRQAAVAPGDSFVARLTLRRAGTFIYHTHLSDVDQLTGGLYGPLIVLEAGEEFDQRRDHPLVISWDGPEEPPTFLLNGERSPPPLELEAGVAHRLRLVCISPVNCARIRLFADSTVMEWTPLAMDGADLPQWQRVSASADVRLWAGMTADFEFRPVPGEYRLVVGPTEAPLLVRPIIVR